MQNDNQLTEAEEVSNILEENKVIALYCYGPVDDPTTRVLLGGATFQYINLIKDIADGKITTVQFRNSTMDTVIDTVNINFKKGTTENEQI